VCVIHGSQGSCRIRWTKRRTSHIEEIIEMAGPHVIAAIPAEGITGPCYGGCGELAGFVSHISDQAIF